MINYCIYYTTQGGCMQSNELFLFTFEVKPQRRMQIASKQRKEEDRFGRKDDAIYVCMSTSKMTKNVYP